MEYVLNNLSSGKAWGIDEIPDEVYNEGHIKQSMIVKLTDVFSNFLSNWKIPDYLITTKLIMISKDGTNTPPIDKIRPIGVLPSITKLFELSFINKIKKLTDYPGCSKR